MNILYIYTNISPTFILFMAVRPPKIPTSYSPSHHFHLKISASFQFNRSGLANKRTEFIIFFPICTTKTIQIQFFWIGGRRRGC